MKTLLLSLVSLAAVSAFADLRIATVEMLTLVKGHPNYDSNKTLLADTEKDYQKKLDGFKADLEKMQTEGRKKAEALRNPMLSASAKASMEKEMVEFQDKFLQGQQRMRNEAMRTQQELQDLEGRLLKGTTEDLRKRITAYAEKNGYDLILDSSAAPFSKKVFDVTDDLLRSMGSDPEKVRARKDDRK